jgi:hypothetical protein
MDLYEFLNALAQDPILVEGFLDDPDGMMDDHDIPTSVRAVLRSRDDVAILNALLDDHPTDDERS